MLIPCCYADGARNTIESKHLKINANSVLIKKQPYVHFSPSVCRVRPMLTVSILLCSVIPSWHRAVNSKCKLCKSALHQPGHYCQACSYKKGICAMCGVKILDTKFYKQSSV